MDKIKKVFKNSLISTWILSYVLLILITLAIVCLAYIQTHKVIRDEIMRGNDDVLTQIKDSMDETINNVEMFAGTAPLNERVVRMSKHKGSVLSAEENYELVSVMRDLSTFSLLASNFEDYFI